MVKYFLEWASNRRARERGTDLLHSQPKSDLRVGDRMDSDSGEQSEGDLSPGRTVTTQVSPMLIIRLLLIIIYN